MGTGSTPVCRAFAHFSLIYRAPSAGLALCSVMGRRMHKNKVPVLKDLTGEGTQMSGRARARERASRWLTGEEEKPSRDPGGDQQEKPYFPKAVREFGEGRTVESRLMGPRVVRPGPSSPSQCSHSMVPSL